MPKIVALHYESNEITITCEVCKKEFTSRQEKIAKRFMKIHMEKTHGTTDFGERGSPLSYFDREKECAQRSGINPSNVKIVRH
jgi:hypothetical protein